MLGQETKSFSIKTLPIKPVAPAKNILNFIFNDKKNLYFLERFILNTKKTVWKINNNIGHFWTKQLIKY